MIFANAFNYLWRVRVQENPWVRKRITPQRNDVLALVAMFGVNF